METITHLQVRSTDVLYVDNVYHVIPMELILIVGANLILHMRTHCYKFLHTARKYLSMYFVNIRHIETCLQFKSQILCKFSFLEYETFLRKK